MSNLSQLLKSSQLGTSVTNVGNLRASGAFDWNELIDAVGADGGTANAWHGFDVRN